MHAVVARAQLAVQPGARRIARLLSERGQGTVEYVGLISAGSLSKLREGIGA